MKKIQVVRGTVIDQSSSKVEKVDTYGSGKDQTVHSRTVNHTRLWLKTLEGKETQVDIEGFSVGFREGHEAAIVYLNRSAALAWNASTENWSAVDSSLVPWGTAVGAISFLAGIIGALIAVFAAGSGHSVHWSLMLMLMMASPFAAFYLAQRTKKSAIATCLAAVGVKKYTVA